MDQTQDFNAFENPFELDAAGTSNSDDTEIAGVARALTRFQHDHKRQVLALHDRERSLRTQIQELQAKIKQQSENHTDSLDLKKVIESAQNSHLARQLEEVQKEKEQTLRILNDLFVKSQNTEHDLRAKLEELETKSKAEIKQNAEFIEQMQEDLGSARKKITALQLMTEEEKKTSDNEALLKMNRLADKLWGKDLEISTLKENISRNLLHLNEKKDLCVELEKELLRSQEKSEQKNSEIDDLENEIEDLSQAVKRLAPLEGTFQQQEKQKNSLLNDLQNLQSESEDLRTELSKSVILGKHLTGAFELEIHRLVFEGQELCERQQGFHVRRLLAEKNQHSQLRSAMQKKIGAMQSEIDAQTSQCQALSVRCLELSSKCREFETAQSTDGGTMQALKNENFSLSKEIHDLKGAEARLTEEISATSNQHQQIIQELTQQLHRQQDNWRLAKEKLEQEKTELESQLGQVSQQLRRQQETLQTIQSQLSSVREQLAQEQLNRQNLTKEHEQSLFTALGQLRSAQLEINKTQAERDSLSRHLQITEEKLTTAEMESDEITSELKTALSDSRRTDDELVLARSVSDAKSAECQRLQKENSFLRTAEQEFRDRTTEAEAKLAEARSISENSVHLLKEKTDKAVALEFENKNLQAEVNDTKNHLTKALADLNSANNEHYRKSNEAESLTRELQQLRKNHQDSRHTQVQLDQQGKLKTQIERQTALLSIRERQLRFYRESLEKERSETLGFAREMAMDLTSLKETHPLRDYIQATEHELSRLEVQLRTMPTMIPERPRLEQAVSELVAQREFLGEILKSARKQLDAKIARISAAINKGRLAPVPPLPPLPQPLIVKDLADNKEPTPFEFTEGESRAISWEIPTKEL